MGKIKTHPQYFSHVEDVQLYKWAILKSVASKKDIDKSKHGLLITPTVNRYLQLLRFVNFHFIFSIMYKSLVSGDWWHVGDENFKHMPLHTLSSTQSMHIGISQRGNGNCYILTFSTTELYTVYAHSWQSEGQCVYDTIQCFLVFNLTLGIYF